MDDGDEVQAAGRRAIAGRLGLAVVAVAMGALCGWAFFMQPWWQALLALLGGVAFAFSSSRSTRLALLAGLAATGAFLMLSVPGGPEAWFELTIYIGICLAILVPVMFWLGALVLALGARAPVHGPRARAILGFVAVAAILAAAFRMPLRPGEYALPTEAPMPAWMPIGCAGIGLDAVVRGDPSDPRVAWLEDHLVAPGTTTFRQIDVRWPIGYRARFMPKIEILDAWGNVVLRDGDRVTGACSGTEPYLSPPF
jgi:hypothetical protein